MTDAPTTGSTDAQQPVTAPRRPSRGRRLLTGGIIVVGLMFVLSACSPAEYKAWLDQRGVDTSRTSQAELEFGAAVATAYWQGVIAELADLHKYDSVLSDAQLARLRACESNGNYAIVSPGGAYRGAYQFSQSTWNSVAGRHFPKYVGKDPAAMPSIVQDAMARALYLEQGRSPWPICGSRL